MRGTKKRWKFLGTPTRPDETLYIDLIRRVSDDGLGVCCAGESTNADGYNNKVGRSCRDCFGIGFVARYCPASAAG
jgi:hypothetical protein